MSATRDGGGPVGHFATGPPKRKKRLALSNLTATRRKSKGCTGSRCSGGKQPDKMANERLVALPPASPYLDRTADLVAISTLPPREVLYPKGVANASTNSHPLFNLETALRRKIYSYCFPKICVPITLSPPFATKTIYQKSDLVSPWVVLQDVEGGLEASSALRNDIMFYFWTEFHFHITLSTLSGPIFSPLSHNWVQGYLDIIQHLTIEIDCTRFGGSYAKSARNSNYNVKKIELQLVDFIRGIAQRGDESTMKELHILCRRYGGSYPYIQQSFVNEFGPDPNPSCYDSVLHIGYSLSSLRGILQKCRMAGFTPAYTKMLLSALFSDGDEQPQYVVPRQSAWPPLSEQLSSSGAESNVQSPWTPSTESGHSEAGAQIPADPGVLLPPIPEDKQTDHGLPTDGVQGDLRRTGSGLYIQGIKGSSPPTAVNPDEMNELNTRDPAFVRALNSPSASPAMMCESEASNTSSAHPSDNPNTEEKNLRRTSTSTINRGAMKQKSMEVFQRLRRPSFS